MAKYTLELTIKYATELTLAGLDEETKEKLESSDDFNDEAYEVFYDSEYVAQGVVMNNDELYNADTFSLIVKDEDDNEIWSTTDVSQIKEYPELDENDEELPIQNFHYHPLQEGDYLVLEPGEGFEIIGFPIEHAVIKTNGATVKYSYWF